MVKKTQDMTEQKLINDDGTPAVLELTPDEFDDNISEKERKLMALEQEIATKQAELAEMTDTQLASLKAHEEARVAEQEVKSDPWKKQREADERLIRVRFDFREQPGGYLEFAYKKYPGEALKIYRGPTRLVDGHVYQLPVGVVKHLMTKGRTPEYRHKRSLDEDSPTNYEVGAWRTRYSCEVLDFFADDELQSLQIGSDQSYSFQR